MAAVATRRIDVDEARRLRDSGVVMTHAALDAITVDDNARKAEADAARAEKRREEEAPAALAEATIAAENYAKAQREHLDACQGVINSAEKLNTTRLAWDAFQRKLRGLKIEPSQWPQAPRKIELTSDGRALVREARNSCEANG
jgi:hypothetical protein